MPTTTAAALTWHVWAPWVLDLARFPIPCGARTPDPCPQAPAYRADLATPTEIPGPHVTVLACPAHCGELRTRPDVLTVRTHRKA